MTDELLTSDEVAAWLKLHVETIRKLTRQHKLPAYNIGGEYRYRREDINAFLERQRTGAQPEEGKK